MTSCAENWRRSKLAQETEVFQSRLFQSELSLLWKTSVCGFSKKTRFTDIKHACLISANENTVFSSTQIDKTGESWSTQHENNNKPLAWQRTPHVPTRKCGTISCVLVSNLWILIQFLCLRREASECIMCSSCPSVRLSGCPSSHVFLYYANMVQQFVFITYTNIQPLRQKFFTKGQGHRSKVKVKDSKKCFVNAITWKIIIASLQIFMWSYSWVWRWPDKLFSFPPIIKMAAS